MTEVVETEAKEFELVQFDELPPAPPRQSRLSETLEKVKQFPHGKPVLIKEYETPTAATGSANHLKMRWGSKPDAYGFSFKTRKVREGIHGLFVIYEPKKIVPGAAAEVDKKYDEFRVKSAERQKLRKANPDKPKGKAGRPPAKSTV